MWNDFNGEEVGEDLNCWKNLNNDSNSDSLTGIDWAIEQQFDYHTTAINKILGLWDFPDHYDPHSDNSFNFIEWIFSLSTLFWKDFFLSDTKLESLHSLKWYKETNSFKFPLDDFYWHSAIDVFWSLLWYLYPVYQFKEIFDWATFDKVEIKSRVLLFVFIDKEGRNLCMKFGLKRSNKEFPVWLSLESWNSPYASSVSREELFEKNILEIQKVDEKIKNFMKDIDIQRRTAKALVWDSYIDVVDTIQVKTKIISSNWTALFQKCLTDVCLYQPDLIPLNDIAKARHIVLSLNQKSIQDLSALSLFQIISIFFSKSKLLKYKDRNNILESSFDTDWLWNMSVSIDWSSLVFPDWDPFAYLINEAWLRDFFISSWIVSPWFTKPESDDDFERRLHFLKEIWASISNWVSTISWLGGSVNNIKAIEAIFSLDCRSILNSIFLVRCFISDQLTSEGERVLSWDDIFFIKSYIIIFLSFLDLRTNEWIKAEFILFLNAVEYYNLFNDCDTINWSFFINMARSFLQNQNGWNSIQDLEWDWYFSTIRHELLERIKSSPHQRRIVWLTRKQVEKMTLKDIPQEAFLTEFHKRTSANISSYFNSYSYDVMSWNPEERWRLSRSRLNRAKNYTIKTRPENLIAFLWGEKALSWKKQPRLNFLEENLEDNPEDNFSLDSK